MGVGPGGLLGGVVAVEEEVGGSGRGGVVVEAGVVEEVDLEKGVGEVPVGWAGGHVREEGDGAVEVGPI